MAEYSKKWKTSFEKKFAKALNQVRELEKEYKEMVESNPDEWDLNWLYIDDATLEYDGASDLTVYHYDGAEEGTKEYVEIVKNVVSDDCEDEEGWEDNEESEYTIQASRTCVQSWTHTVIARSSCEAYRKVQEDTDGSTHDENDDYDQYGEIDYEII